MTRGEKNKNVIFDIIVPYDVEEDKEKSVLKKLKKDIVSLNSIYNCVIQIDREFNTND